MIVESIVRKERIGDKDHIYYFKMTKSSIEISETHLPFEMKLYGIEIERQDMISEKMVKVEKDCIKFISPHRYKVHNLLKVLYENIVSPIHLIDIAGEYADDLSCDYDLIAIPVESK
jgi:hypothetical protein